jgi:hypothetical protein
MTEALRRGRRWLLVAEALAWLTLASLAIRLAPFHRLAPLLGPVGPAAGTEPAAIDADQRDRLAAWRIGRAVLRAARVLPWPALCLPQAMAAKAMLACRGRRSRLHLGVASRENGLAAHAWLTLGPMTVIGGPGRQDYAELARFG